MSDTRYPNPRTRWQIEDTQMSPRARAMQGPIGPWNDITIPDTESDMLVVYTAIIDCGGASSAQLFYAPNDRTQALDVARDKYENRRARIVGLVKGDQVQGFIPVPAPSVCSEFTDPYGMPGAMED